MSSSSDLEEFSKTHCDCCQEDIPGIGVECLECRTRSVQLCCECFGLGAEIGRHRPHHKYRFFDCSGDLFLYPKDPLWATKEHLRLLDGIEIFGHGNFKSLSAYILSEESKRRKVSIDKESGKLTWPRCRSLEPKTPYQCVDDGPLKPNITAKLSPLMITSDESSKLGCMGLTDDYEKEYDNDAEELVSELKYSTDDEETDYALKLTLVDIYTTRLRERLRRKRIVRDYQLVGEFFKKKARTKDKSTNFERNIREVLKPFTQFHTANEHSHIIRNMAKERELVFRIQELNKYRQHGITKPEDCFEFDRVYAKKSEKLNGNIKSEKLNGNTKSLSHESQDISEMKSRKRKRKRLLLSHQKSHTTEVLRRRRLHKVPSRRSRNRTHHSSNSTAAAHGNGHQDSDEDSDS